MSDLLKKLKIHFCLKGNYFQHEALMLFQEQKLDIKAGIQTPKFSLTFLWEACSL